MTEILKWFGISLFACIWVYIVVRMAARAVIRTLREEEEKNG